MEKSQTYRLLDAARVVSNLSPIGELPTHESQVRPLTGLEPDQQREAWELATEINPNPTKDRPCGASLVLDFPKGLPDNS
jgi:hypothetical protein